MIASSLSAFCMVIALLVRNNSTATPLLSKGVMTMKMISNTNITSTMGVTLISDTIAGAVGFLIGGSYDAKGLLFPCGVSPRQTPQGQPLLSGSSALRPLQEIIDQFGAGIVHLDVESFHAVGEVVVHPHGRDSHQQTDGGGDQRFRNTAGDSRQTGRLGGRNSFERVDDADHRSQQSNEGRGGGDGCQSGNTALE